MDIKTLKTWKEKKEYLGIPDHDFKPQNGRILCYKVSAEDIKAKGNIMVADTGLVDQSGQKLETKQILDLQTAEGYSRWVVVDMSPDVEIFYEKMNEEKPDRYITKGDTIITSDNMMFIELTRKNRSFMIAYYMDIISFVPFETDEILQSFEDKKSNENKN